jgi:hypothetical protein
LCLAAVTNDGWALECVPGRFKDYNLCLVAVANSGWALQIIPAYLIDYALCLAVVRNNGWALAYAPDKFKTLELICITIDNSPDFDIKRRINWELLTADDQDYLKLKYGITK